MISGEILGNICRIGFRKGLGTVDEIGVANDVEMPRLEGIPDEAWASRLIDLKRTGSVADSTVDPAAGGGPWPA
jgi:hypothetical protein